MMQRSRCLYNRLHQSYSACRTQQILHHNHRFQVTNALLEKNPEISGNALSAHAILDSCEIKHYDRTAHRKQSIVHRFVDLRRTKLKQMLEDPEAYHPVILSLLSAQTSSELLRVLETMDREQFSVEETLPVDHDVDDEDRHMHPSLHRVFSKAIRCCADMGEMEVCWQIFEQCKQEKIVSNELYNTMMWVCMYDRRDVPAWERVMQLYEELQAVAESHNLGLHPRTFSTLLNSCCKAKQFGAGLRIYSDLKRNRKHLLQNTRVCQSVVWLLCKAGNVDQAMKELRMFATASEDDSVWCNHRFWTSTVLSAIARRLYHGVADQEHHLQLAEECFTNSLHASLKHKVEIPVSLMNAMIHVYGSCKDYESCLALLQRMQLMQTNQKKVLPAPTATTFEYVVRSLFDHTDREQKQQHMRHVVQLLDKAGVARTWHLYNVLIQVCQDDAEAAKQWYCDMVNESNKTPNIATFKILLNVGVNDNREELRAFTQWIIGQQQKYNCIVDSDLKEALKGALQ